MNGGEFEFGTDGPKAILVGVDGSPTSLHAFSYAIGLARRQRSRLVVVFVETTPGITGMVATTAAAFAESTSQVATELKQQVESIAAEMGVACEFLAGPGDPYSELIRIAKESQVDAIVVGSSTHAGHRLIGSLAIRLVKAGRWPVTVVP
jgi:nucleotide-binding universal stress UspA family protein